ncbi:cupredoxin domain-containing protein [Bradyrhizobium sp. 157]|uniref:cupredoxin domain-containing protein n=1 Tax=Bradyrhizobium sp. 157 TaxID=2782631 RepID=UPI001FF76E44|nr:cupredoxin domain-containing protein [Bradyrhizobium sp. 157]
MPNVKIFDDRYDPPRLEVHQGDRVAWSNNGGTVHSARADDGSFDTGRIDPGKTAEEVIKQPPGSTIWYHDFHVEFRGEIVVVK